VHGRTRRASASLASRSAGRLLHGLVGLRFPGLHVLAGLRPASARHRPRPPPSPCPDLPRDRATTARGVSTQLWSNARVHPDAASLVIVRVEDAIDARLTERIGGVYESPPQPRAQAGACSAAARPGQRERRRASPLGRCDRRRGASGVSGRRATEMTVIRPRTLVSGARCRQTRRAWT